MVNVNEKRNNQKIYEYYKRTTRTFKIQFSRSNDASVIEQLENVENKTDYLRSLILNDIKAKNLK